MADGIELKYDTSLFDDPKLSSTTSVTLTRGLALTRSVGRPKAELRAVTNADRPKYIDKQRSAHDGFELSGAFLSGTPEADAKTLRDDLLGTPLGRDWLTLTFQNGVWNLSSYDVVPVGSRAGRVTYSFGETGIVRVNSLQLRRVDNS